MVVVVVVCHTLLYCIVVVVVVHGCGCMPHAGFKLVRSLPSTATINCSTPHPAAAPTTPCSLSVIFKTSTVNCCTLYVAINPLDSSGLGKTLIESRAMRGCVEARRLN